MTSIFYKIQLGKKKSVHCVQKVKYCFEELQNLQLCTGCDIIFSKNGYGNSSNLATPRQEADSHFPFEFQQDFVQQNKNVAERIF